MGEMDDMDLAAARELVSSAIWPKVRDAFLAGGGFCVYPRGDLRRLSYLPESVRRQIALWKDALGHVAEWRKIVDGERVRALKASYPGVYPDVLRYECHFSRFFKDGAPEAASDGELTMRLLKLKFPEAYELCCS